jgi:hypothetical protein
MVHLFWMNGPGVWSIVLVFHILVLEKCGSRYWRKAVKKRNTMEKKFEACYLAAITWIFFFSLYFFLQNLNMCIHKKIKTCTKSYHMKSIIYFQGTDSIPFLATLIELNHHAYTP